MPTCTIQTDVIWILRPNQMQPTELLVLCMHEAPWMEQCITSSLCLLVSKRQSPGLHQDITADCAERAGA